MMAEQETMQQQMLQMQYLPQQQPLLMMLHLLHRDL